jgi:pyrimidine operon attenuation protein/uracil phosphoribosyltransferase
VNNVKMMDKKYILNKEEVSRKIRRLAYEIAERNFGETELYLAGIREQGFYLAKLLVEELRGISSLQTQLFSITLDKRSPDEIILDPILDFNGKNLLLVDDVASSGKTMLYALKPLLNFHPKKIETLVLVERTHKQFPVKVDYVGLSVATTLEEHIFVEVVDGEIVGAYMN